MNMEFYRKLPTPKELKEEFPASDKIENQSRKRRQDPRYLRRKKR